LGDRALPWWASIAGASALAVLLAGPAGTAGTGAPAGLSGLEQLKPAYDLILDARFARAAASLRTACGPAPREACEVLEATSLWWQILLDPKATRLDQTLLAETNQAIEACERWVAREPRRAEAWFYLGAAYGARVSFRVERGERLAAARDGKRIKDALERALALEPAFEDARFGIGLYKYYADIAPTAAKILRFLLLLPGGDKVEGLRDMEATEARGRLVAGEALYQLHWIYLWYEHQFARGLSALERLHAAYPGNPHFLQRIADVQVEYFHDAARSLAAWQRMIDTAPQSGAPPLAEARGRLGAAVQLDALYETDRAVPLLRRLADTAPAAPYGAGARAHLLLGRMLDRLGDRAGAVAAYRAALAAAPAGDPDDVRRQARVGLDRGPDARRAEGYRVGLEGWRAFERGDTGAAIRDLTRARTLAPSDAVLRVRLARAGAAADPAHAAAEYEQVIAMRPEAPGVALSAAYLWSAELLEARGLRTRAIDRYRAAARVFAGDSRLGDEARRALARLKAGG
jgi:tetratricopeptide (TPR) repeat protein